MKKCLETNVVCSNNNKLCKVCKLDDCRNTFTVIEKAEENQYSFKLRKIKAQLNKECRDCSLLQIINLDKQIVYCPYRAKGKCILSKKKEGTNIEKNNFIP